MCLKRFGSTEVGFYSSAPLVSDDQEREYRADLSLVSE